MATTRNLARARRVRSIQADIDKRTESIIQHKSKIAQRRAELKTVRKQRGAS